jgi:hypothetical protein
MKTLSIILICVFVLSFIGCGHDLTYNNGETHKTIGIINILVNDSSVMEAKDPKMKYEIIWGNVVWGALLAETVIAPIYFFGFSMFQPVGEK